MFSYSPECISKGIFNSVWVKPRYGDGREFYPTPVLHFKYKDEFNVRVLVPLLNWLITKRDKLVEYKKVGGNKLKYFGYTEYPMKALNEMRKMTNAVRPRLSKVKCPTMLVHTRKDFTSIFENYHIVKK